MNSDVGVEVTLSRSLILKRSRPRALVPRVSLPIYPPYGLIRRAASKRARDLLRVCEIDNIAAFFLDVAARPAIRSDAPIKSRPRIYYVIKLSNRVGLIQEK